MAPAKEEAPDDLHHYQSHSHRIKSVGAVIICCLLQQKPQQITQKNPGVPPAQRESEAWHEKISSQEFYSGRA